MESNIYFLSTICHEEFSRRPSATSDISVRRSSASSDSDADTPQTAKIRATSVVSASEITTSALDVLDNRTSPSSVGAVQTYPYSRTVAEYRAQFLPTFTMKYLAANVQQPPTTLKTTATAANASFGTGIMGNTPLANELRRNSKTALK